MLEGWGGSKLLDSYDAERRPVFRSTIDDFIAKSIKADGDFLEAYSPERDPASFHEALQARAQGAVGEVHAFEPNYEGSLVVLPSSGERGVTSAKGSHRFEAKAGHHLAPVVLESGINVFEVLGSWYTLLALGADAAAVQAFRDAARQLNIPLTIIEDSGQGESSRYGAKLVLVRPDQFVAWTSCDTQDATDKPLKVLSLAKGADATTE
jgi:4-hydroxyisophthalate hydroxylase